MSLHPSSRLVSRRKVLTGAGALGLSPFIASLHSVMAREAAGEKPPQRFVFCVKTNGLWAEMIQPASMSDRLPFGYETEMKEGKINVIKDSWEGDRTSMFEAANEKHLGKLNETMSPLAPFADRLTILQGLTSGFNMTSGAHKGNYQTLSATQAGSKVVGPTLDVALANALPAPIPLLCLGHDSKAFSGLSYIPYSASANGKPNAFYTKPSRAYADLFGVIDGGAAKSQYEVQSSILDLHAKDAKRLRSRIGAPEREQLDRYLGAFDSLRQSREQIEKMSDQLRKHAPEAPGDVEISNPLAINAANAEIAVASLISGLTNVVTLCFDQMNSTSYPGAGPLHSSVGHGQGGAVLHKRRLITGSHFEQIAAMAGQLESVPEGDGTMLDNTVFVYLADNGRSHHSGETNFPMMLLGNLGGRLQQGIYYAPGNDPADKTQKSHVRVGDVWSTLLAASGQNHKGFGIPKNKVPYQPIESLLG